VLKHFLFPAFSNWKHKYFIARNIMRKAPTVSIVKTSRKWMVLMAANVVTVSQKGRGSEDATHRMESTRKHQ